MSDESEYRLASRFYGKYIQPFAGCRYIHDGRGYIVWRVGTGENVEILHLRAFETGKGIGPILVKKMLKILKTRPPYFSVFGFMLASNEPVIKMYKRLGFDTQVVKGLYAHDDGVMITGEYKKLLEHNGL